MCDRKGNARVIVRVGNPVRFVTGSFMLELVGQDWDGRFKPINQLSYRKRRKPRGKK